MRVGRKQRKHLRSLDAAETKACNRIRKTKERDRRDVRMLASIKTGSLPYGPPVTSWLCRKLHKKVHQITPQDVQSLLG